MDVVGTADSSSDNCESEWKPVANSTNDADGVKGKFYIIGEGFPTIFDEIANDITGSDLINVNLADAGSDTGVFYLDSTAEDSSTAVFRVLTTNNDIPTEALEYNGHRYYIYPGGTSSTWEDAKAYCESLGGHLAVINNEAENNALYD